MDRAARIDPLRSMQASRPGRVRVLPETRPAGPGIMRMLDGVARHEAYHNGQIGRLRAMFGRGARGKVNGE